FIWVGIFNNASIAQVWSLANDLYSKEAGERLFPIIAIGATLGGPLGSLLGGYLFKTGLPAATVLQVSAAMLALQLFLYFVVIRRESRRPSQAAKAHET